MNEYKVGLRIKKKTELYRVPVHAYDTEQANMEQNVCVMYTAEPRKVMLTLVHHSSKLALLCN